MLSGVTDDMLIYREETFGPVAGLTPFDDEEQAIAYANDTVYGLAAYFHTRDYARLLRVAEKLDYGIVGANTGIISAANAPFGGVKESGYGREGGSVGIDEYLDGQVRLRRRRRDLGPYVRAMRQLAYGEPLVLQNVPEPEPGPGEVVVTVTRAAVNPLDVWVSRGTVAAAGPLPRTGGSEGAGVTEEGRRVAFRGAGSASRATAATPSASRCRPRRSPTCRTASPTRRRPASASPA